MYMSWELYQLY